MSDSARGRFPRMSCWGSVLTDGVFPVELACAPICAKGFAAGGGVALAGLILILGLATGSTGDALSIATTGFGVGLDAEASAPALEVFSEPEDVEPANFSMRRRRI